MNEFNVLTLCPVCWEPFNSLSKAAIPCRNNHLTCIQCINAQNRAIRQNPSADIASISKCPICRCKYYKDSPKTRHQMRIIPELIEAFHTCVTRQKKREKRLKYIIYKKGSTIHKLSRKIRKEKLKSSFQPRFFKSATNENNIFFL